MALPRIGKPQSLIFREIQFNPNKQAFANTIPIGHILIFFAVHQPAFDSGRFINIDICHNIKQIKHCAKMV
jgi:hypothetical protein